jgi:hypothetical protein
MTTTPNCDIRREQLNWLRTQIHTHYKEKDYQEACKQEHPPQQLLVPIQRTNNHNYHYSRYSGYDSCTISNSTNLTTISRNNPNKK